METAPTCTSIEVLLRTTLGQSDESSDLRGSLSPTTQHRCTHVLVYTAPHSPRRSPILGPVLMNIMCLIKNNLIWYTVWNVCILNQDTDISNRTWYTLFIRIRILDLDTDRNPDHPQNVFDCFLARDTPLIKVLCAQTRSLLCKQSCWRTYTQAKTTKTWPPLTI